MSRTQKITTYLWFNGNAEEAVGFYTSVFPDSRVTRVARWGAQALATMHKIDIARLQGAHAAP